MASKEILIAYNIEMINSIISMPKTGEKYIRKTFLGGSEMEPYFDLAFRSAPILNQDVLPIVQHFINGNSPLMDPNIAELGGIDNYALPYVDAIRFHNPNNGEITQTIPLEHFKVIAEAWRDFLLQTPLNGTKVK